MRSTRGLAAALALTLLASAAAQAAGRRDCRLGMKLDSEGRCVKEKESSAAKPESSTVSGGPGTGMPALGAPPPDPGQAGKPSAAPAPAAPAAAPAAGASKGSAEGSKSGFGTLSCPKGFFKTPSGRCARG